LRECPGGQCKTGAQHRHQTSSIAFHFALCPARTCSAAIRVVLFNLSNLQIFAVFGRSNSLSANLQARSGRVKETARRSACQLLLPWRASA
jgi:hypothetical protein